MVYPPLQKNNPYNIQHKQHVLTKRLLIEHSDRNKIWVLDVAAGNVVERSVRNWRGQWLKRRWNQQAEKIVTKYEIGLHGKVEDIKKRNVFSCL